MHSDMTSSFSTNWFKIQKTTLWLTAVSRVFNIIEDCQWKWLFYFSLVLLFLCIKQPWSSNPKTLTASKFARVKSITGLLDRLETDSVRREKSTTVCNIFTFAKNCHQNLYMKVNMFSKQLILLSKQLIFHIITTITSFHQLLKQTEHFHIKRWA